MEGKQIQESWDWESGSWRQMSVKDGSGKHEAGNECATGRGGSEELQKDRWRDLCYLVLQKAGLEVWKVQKKKVWGSLCCKVNGLGVAKQNFLGLATRRDPEPWINCPLHNVRGATLRTTGRRFQKPRGPACCISISEERSDYSQESKYLPWLFFFFYWSI